LKKVVPSCIIGRKGYQLAELTMPESKPYQPLLLRLLHGVNAAIALLAIITAFLVYNTYDGRFGKVPVPQIADIIGIHGTFGKLLILGVMPAFA